MAGPESLLRINQPTSSSRLYGRERAQVAVRNQQQTATPRSVPGSVLPAGSVDTRSATRGKARERHPAAEQAAQPGGADRPVDLVQLRHHLSDRPGNNRRVPVHKPPDADPPPIQPSRQCSGHSGSHRLQ